MNGRVIRTICLNIEADELYMKIPAGERSKFLSQCIKKKFEAEKKPDNELKT